jgi:hypothetical protein
MAVNISKLIESSGIIKSAQGTSYFTDVNDALGKLGGELRSPSFDSLDNMRNNAQSLQIVGKVDQFALQQAFGQDGEDIWQVLTQVQDVSDGMTNCGDFMEGALLGAQADFIRNSGIQQAGRELSRALGSADEMADCVAGFATLLDSAGIIDDALGMGDLPQLNSRVRSIIEDSTNASSLNNILANTAVVQNLVNDYNNMCGEMMGKVNALIQKDVDAMGAALTKLAQWAAFAKLATSDPCALVNTNRMLGHIAEPVMDDIVKLYQGVTGQSVTLTDPIIPLGEFLGKPLGTVVDVPKLKQAASEGLPGFGQVADAIPIGQELHTSEYTKTAMEYVNGVGWVLPEDAKTDFTKGILDGKSPFGESATRFRANAAHVEHKAVSEHPLAVAKVHKVSWCDGGNQEAIANRNERECAATGGEWKEKEMTDNEVQVAGSLEAAMGNVAKSLADVFDNIVGDPPASSGSSALSGANIPVVVSKARQTISNLAAFAGAPATPFDPSKPPTAQKYSPDPKDPMPFESLAMASYTLAAELPGAAKLLGGAKLPPDVQKQLSNIGGDISEVHQSREVVELAMKTGDWSNVETCTCQPRKATAGAVEVGQCDFTGLGFPDGYKLIEPSFYTPALLAKVQAAEATNTGEYVTGDDGNIYQSAEVVVMSQYGATIVNPFEQGKEACIKYSGKWTTTVEAAAGASGSGSTFDITNAKSKQVCENANGSWVCKKGGEHSSSGRKAIESHGKFTNKKNVNTKSKLPSESPFNTDKLPSLTFSKLV